MPCGTVTGVHPGRCRTRLEFLYSRA
jgi:hypothetical protein